MLKALKQARAALTMLHPEEVRKRAEQPVHFGLVATSDSAYREMEDFLAPGSISLEERTYLLDRVHRAADPHVPQSVDLILFEEALEPSKGTYRFYGQQPSATAAEILKGNPDLELPLARQFPAFRKQAVDRMIQAVARENALFAVTTALPDIVPSLMEVPWALGEFASDTAFLTGNQVRLAFLIAAACGRETGFLEQKAALLSIAAGAFGWRALARELVGKIPFGGGLIPKGAIAYAGTYVAGKGLEHFYMGNGRHTRRQQRALYHDALERGREVAGDLASAR